MAKIIKNKSTTKIGKASKLKQKFPIVRICLKATPNNSIAVLTDLEGKVISWASSGKVGFKGTKKATPFASQKVTEDMIEKAKMVEAVTAYVVINGAGAGRDSFLRTLMASHLQIKSITDTTGFPFGGPKKANRRRI